MSVQGKNSLSYKKKNTENQNQPHTGFKNLVFGHQFASAGETIIPFDGLVTPTDWPAAGLVNPIPATLLAAQLQVFKDNVTVTSSARGIIQKSEYLVKSNRIEFLNIESLANEVFEVEVSDLMITGNLIVDMQTIRIEGELQDTETDFNLGYEFDVLNEEVIVFRDGIQMFRSDNNDSSGATGNYYYVDDDGDSRSTVIRFFEAAVGVEPILVATTGGVVDPANVSTFQQIEHLAGQLDAIVPTVAALAGVPESNFRAGPNNVDLKQFGDLLIDVRDSLDGIQQEITDFKANSTVTVSENYLDVGSSRLANDPLRTNQSTRFEDNGNLLFSNSNGEITILRDNVKINAFASWYSNSSTTEIVIRVNYGSGYVTLSAANATNTTFDESCALDVILNTGDKIKWAHVSGSSTTTRIGLTASGEVPYNDLF
jgi:hypothetical protein